MDINLKTAAQFFNTTPYLTKWIPKQSYDKCIVKFEKDNDIIRKVVTRRDGTEATGLFRNNRLIKAAIENIKGKIIIEDISEQTKHLPPMLRADRSITIVTADGDKFTREVSKENGILDEWKPKNRVVKIGQMDSLFKEYLNKVKNK